MSESATALKMPSRRMAASDPSPRPAAEFERLLAQAERQHRTGRQRSAMTLIGKLAELVTPHAGICLDSLFALIELRRRVLLAMDESR